MRHIRQAGAIAVRRADREARILIVRAKRNPHYWIFPKGHIERRESPRAAAVRELQEEAGVRGTVIAPAGALEFPWRKSFVHVEYFLVKHRRDVPREEDREIRWCSYARALALLSFPDSRRLLRQARPRIGRALRVSI